MLLEGGGGAVCMCDGGLCEQREVGGDGWREGGHGVLFLMDQQLLGSVQRRKREGRVA